MFPPKVIKNKPQQIVYSVSIRWVIIKYDESKINKIFDFNTFPIGFKSHLMTSEVGPYHRDKFPLGIALRAVIEKKNINLKIGIG